MDDLKVYELTMKTFLLRDLNNQEAQGQLAKLLVEYLSKDEKFLALHKSKEYKPYCFDSLYPIKKFYPKEHIYQFRIRSINPSLVNYLLNSFANFQNTTFKNLTIDAKVIANSPLDKVFTLTPVLIKNNQGYWKDHMSTDTFERRIQENLFKKYKYFVREDILEDTFYQNIRFLNNAPIGMPLKGKVLLGDKIELTLHLNDMSQKLAYLALGTTFSENNSYGCGFLGYKYLRR